MIQRERVTYYLDGAHTPVSIGLCSRWFKSCTSDRFVSFLSKIVEIIQELKMTLKHSIVNIETENYNNKCQVI